MNLNVYVDFEFNVTAPDAVLEVRILMVEGCRIPDTTYSNSISKCKTKNAACLNV